MANRRKFLAGLGALASGSAAAVGTGALSSVSAERSVSVAVATDENSFLGLNPTDQRAYQEGGQLKLDFASSDVQGATNAEGLNPNSRTTFLDLFEVVNRGEDPVYVGVGTQKSDVYASTVSSGNRDNHLFDFSNLSGYVYAEGTTGQGTGLPFNGGNGNMVIDSGGRVDLDFQSNSKGGTTASGNNQIIAPGDSLTVDFDLIVDGKDLGGGGGKRITVAAADPDIPRDTPDT
ncbi:DUF1102 domain-containing protein [Halorubrum ezzemoulense]|uniref:DUF1102 domain-containing protein n=1 Tax=Halorubrum ezzemoulense TaxID=337243 RepID=UPI00232F2363|nr:DUF1102 domain-containing protein [Halorubrum ezzemoulense]MDB2275158.1 DUF1102 domain-containing protein [Halorubrum ezzemoulense]